MDALAHWRERALRDIADTSRYDAPTEARDVDAECALAAMEAEGLIVVDAATYRGAVERVEALEKAIREHRLSFSNQGDEIDPDDEKLWMVLHDAGGR